MVPSTNHSKCDESDVFRGFSFYDSPLEENEILTQIKKCCIKIGQLPQHLYSAHPSANYQKNLNNNLHKMQSHMQQWMSSSRRFICEEQDEEDEQTNKKSEGNGLQALPSESSSIIIDQNDITLENIAANIPSNSK